MYGGGVACTRDLMSVRRSTHGDDANGSSQLKHGVNMTDDHTLAGALRRKPLVSSMYARVDAGV
jgi:hypothetical protein